MSTINKLGNMGNMLIREGFKVAEKRKREAEKQKKQQQQQQQMKI